QTHRTPRSYARCNLPAVHFAQAPLVGRIDQDLGDVHVRRARGDPDDHVGDVLCGQRTHPRVDLLRLVLVAEADDGEFRLRQARGDVRNADLGPVQLEPERVRNGADRVLHGSVHAAAFVDAVSG